MKRFLSVLLSLTFIFTLTATLGLNEVKADESVTIIYANVPDDWTAPHVWTWDDDGNGAFANLGWPGKEMKEDTNNPGWYYLYIPSTMTNVIINANDGGIQTDGIAITGDSWITITTTTETVDGEEVVTVTPVVDTTAQTTGDLPTYIPTKYVYAYVPVDWDTAAIWAWNFASGVGVYTTWPGEEMELLDDGWFRVEVPDDADRVIINNFGTTDPTLQTVDLEVGTEDVYIMLDEDPNTEGKYTATLTAEKPVILEDAFTVFVTVPEDWTTPSIWAWSHPDGTNVYTTWPGEPLVLNSESGYYEIQLPQWVNRIIINNGVTGDGAAQTVDGEVVDSTIDQYITIGDVDNEGKYAISFSDTAPLICPVGQHEEDGACVDDVLECPLGQHEEDGACVDDELECPAGQHEEDGVCVLDSVDDPEDPAEESSNTGLIVAISSVALVGVVGGTLFFIRRRG